MPQSVKQREEHQAQPSAPESSSVPEQPATEPAHADPAAEPSQSSGATIPAPPSVRRLARELGVDLTHVKGLEAGGRITAEDVKAYVRERTRRAGAPSSKDGDEKGGNVFSTMYGNERREAIPSFAAENRGDSDSSLDDDSTRPSVPGRRHYRSPRHCTSAMRRNSKKKAQR